MGADVETLLDTQGVELLESDLNVNTFDAEDYTESMGVFSALPTTIVPIRKRAGMLRITRSIHRAARTAVEWNRE